MQTANKQKPIWVAGVIIALCLGCMLVVYVYLLPELNNTKTANMESSSLTAEQTQEPVKAYVGELATIDDSFSVKVPNGWTASISISQNFLALMFARPNQLDSLTYNVNTAPTITRSGIPSWSGLTEHFFVIAPTPSRQFNQNDHLEVTSEPFMFDDGFVGEKYYVVKHAAEAQKWGGLQKDTEWQGRTYIYEKNEKRLEAHLALYPSTNVDIGFYEDVIRTLQHSSN